MPIDQREARKIRRKLLGDPAATAAGLTPITALRPAYRVRDMPTGHFGYLEPSAVFYGGTPTDPVVYVDPDAVLHTFPVRDISGEADGFELGRVAVTGGEYRYQLSAVSTTSSGALYEPGRSTAGMLPITNIEVYEPSSERFQRVLKKHQLKAATAGVS